MMESFIDKFEQHYPDQNTVAFMHRIKQMRFSERVTAFSDLGIDVLTRYQEILGMKQKPIGFEKYNKYDSDFNQLMARATRKISEGEADDSISYLRYLLIDEYQDFSELFYSFVQAVLQRNDRIQLFCVGDTCQAINRFMGADTMYFDKFSEFFPLSAHLGLHTNYRSSKTVVDISNQFMQSYLPAKELAKSVNLTECKCYFYNIDNTFIAMNSDYYSYEIDSKYKTLLAEKGQDPKLTKYIKTCVELIKKHRGDKIYFLNRKNLILNYEITEFMRKIKNLLSEDGWTPSELNQIEIMTMHKAKGLQADLVVVLCANVREIPKIHPNNELFEVFDENSKDLLLDEVKLFYVAITRAKGSFVVLFDDELTTFAKNLNLSELVLDT